ncbi:MAG: hypothetical protein WC695_02455 [Candidatus Omnitrophota bacterium]
MKSLKQGYGVAGVLLVLCFAGCASLGEGVKGVAGVSTKILVDGRKDALSKTFDYDYTTSNAKVLEVLDEVKAYIYAKDAFDHLIAVYVSDKDTTPVGIFLKAIDANKTQIEISSPSTYAKEWMAGKIFTAFDESLKNQLK